MEKTIEDFARATSAQRLEALKEHIESELVSWIIHIHESAGLKEDPDCFSVILKELPLIINDYNPCDLEYEIIKYRISNGIKDNDEEFQQSPELAAIIKEYIESNLDITGIYDELILSNRGLYNLIQLAVILGDTELKTRLERWVISL